MLRKLRKGRCKRCGFKGLTEPLPFLSPTVPGEAPDLSTLPMIAQCVTCALTPPGAESENITHRRLPASEYAKDKR